MDNKEQEITPTMDMEEQENTPETEKPMEDLPPEVLTIILEHLTKEETKNNMLGYRLVNSQWKGILNSLLEKKVVSGKFLVFPAMKVGGPPEQLNVYCSPFIFGATGTHFPANSLLLNGPTSFPERPSDIQMDLPLFMSKFGATLTSFALHHVIISRETLTRMLDPLSSLRVLQLEDVELAMTSIGSKTVILPPPLPSLTSLEVNSGFRIRHKNGSRNHLYIWLAASYADQLVGLNIKTGYPLPALQQRHQYSYPLANGKTFSIVSTSASAFGKLKELSILRPTRNFLELSEFPSLQRLSVTGLAGFARLHQPDLRNLAVLIGNCGQTLEKIYLDIRWPALVSEKVGQRIRLGLQHQQLLSVVPKLKTLAIHYPSQDFQEWILSEELLPMFPALEVLQLLNFVPHDLDCKKSPGRKLDGDGNQMGGADDDLVTLKERCTLLRQQMCDIQRNAAEFWDRVQARPDFQEEPEPEVAAQRRQLAADAEEFQSGMTNARIERERVFQRLADLGEKREKLIVEQLLERRGVWIKCPNLRIVSVSSGREPLGDMCWIRRLDDV